MRRGLLVVLACLLPWPVWAQSQNANTDADLDVLNECVAMEIAGMGTGAWQVSGTFVGTVTWTVSANAGDFVAIDAATPADPGTAVNSTTAPGLWTAGVASLRQMRACMTSYTSGTASVTLSAAGTGGGTGGGGGGVGGGDASAANQATEITHLDTIDNIVSGTGVNVSQLAGATTPMTTTQADGLANTLDGLNGTSFGYVYNATTWDRMRGDATNGVLVNLGTNNDVDTELPAAAAASDTMANPTAPMFIAANAVWNGTTWQRATPITDPCDGAAKTYVAINQTTGTQLFTGTASMRTYICHVNLITASAQNIALVSGTGTVCATSLGPIFGGTTAATGWNFAANGGIVIGNGSGSIGKSDTDADNICLLQSAAGQISGVIAYVVAAN